MYKDRSHAGKLLADKLRAYSESADCIVLALPRGGVPVGFELAQELKLPLDVFIVRKLGTPGQKELAMGAIASGGIRVLNRGIIDALAVNQASLEEVTRLELIELQRREFAYRGSNEPLELKDKTVILTDDGLATGASMRAAVRAVRSMQPRRIIVAVPVSSPGTCRELGREVDEMICAAQPQEFWGVGEWYDNFEQTSDEEVHRLLDRARALHNSAA
ncbi:MAG TPA: phosphoribosyltransferase [Planktothrix sp.]|jgi:putative phosphoribosyl transferase